MSDSKVGFGVGETVGLLAEVREGKVCLKIVKDMVF